uniref:CBS domain-containing protein n=1 Tax=Arcella intermedia TaxID=1963864 RepID=A0A6B2LEL9_9EUKA
MEAFLLDKVQRTDPIFLPSTGEWDPESLMKAQTVLEVLQKTEIADEDPWVPLDQSTSLKEVLEYFTKKQNCHRVFLRDGQGKVCSVLSQLTLLKFFQRKIDSIPVSLLETRVEQFFESGDSNYRRKVEVVPYSESACSAYQKMGFKGLSEIAISSSSGSIIGSLSGKDLIRNSSNYLTSLYKPVALYCGLESPDKRTCTRNDTLETIIDKFCEGNVHKLYVITPQNVPEGVISLCDILSVFLPH